MQSHTLFGLWFSFKGLFFTFHIYFSPLIFYWPSPTSSHLLSYLLSKNERMKGCHCWPYPTSLVNFLRFFIMQVHFARIVKSGWIMIYITSCSLGKWSNLMKNMIVFITKLNMGNHYKEKEEHFRAW